MKNNLHFIGNRNLITQSQGKSYFAMSLVAEAILKGGGALMFDTKGEKTISLSREFRTRRFKKKKH